PSHLPSLLSCSLALRLLPSFPTRRSSDLQLRVHAVVPRDRRCVARDHAELVGDDVRGRSPRHTVERADLLEADDVGCERAKLAQDRKSTRLNSSHRTISYAVFCLKKKKKT